LPRLSWLAYAGNPFSEKAEQAAVAQHPIDTINWEALTLQQQLGEGASGVIYQAQWQQKNNSPLGVAVKLFKGAVTSDGLPHSEMAACISAGSHPNLVPVEGKVGGHPEGAEGLVLELIDPAFRNLAGPPSFVSCTRDIYDPETIFSVEAALQIAHGIASAAEHLHERGIMHGDLYAHNILTTEAGASLLSDFGAACFFDRKSVETAHTLQRLEVRAFGCLLEELVERCQGSLTLSDVMFETLADLQQRCLQPTVSARPLFTEIHQTLAELQTVGQSL
jgi:serine/threonine protein kinase